jgi:hypothetical protein
MCLEAEYRGSGTGYKLGLDDTSATTDTLDSVFRVVELSFSVVFTLEVLMKAIVLRCSFWRSAWNVSDVIIVAIAWLEMGFYSDVPFNPMLLRLARLVRLVELLEIFRAYAVFDYLFLMVKGIKASLPVLIWVIVVVIPIMACCYIILPLISSLTRVSRRRAGLIATAISVHSKKH